MAATAVARCGFLAYRPAIMSKRNQITDWTDLPFAATFGGTTVAVLLTCLLAPLSAQIAVVGTILALVLGVLLTRDRHDGAVLPASDLIQQSFLIAKDDETHRQHRIYAGALTRIVQHADPLFRSLALQRMAGIAAEADEITSGTIVFEDTETWRLSTTSAATSTSASSSWTGPAATAASTGPFRSTATSRSRSRSTNSAAANSPGPTAARRPWSCPVFGRKPTNTRLFRKRTPAPDFPIRARKCNSDSAASATNSTATNTTGSLTACQRFDWRASGCTTAGGPPPTRAEFEDEPAITNRRVRARREERCRSHT